MRMGQDSQVEPAIAESYELSEDNLTYTFHLREAYWSNGDPITAYDFEYTWKQVIDPTSGYSLGVQNLYPIKNARAIIKGRKSIDTAGIRAIDEKTLKVQLENPTPYFLEVTATSSYFPINSKVDLQDPDWAKNDGDCFVCNGPFSLKHRKVENEILVLKNENYWDNENVKIPGIRIAILSDSDTQLHLFEKGELDWLGKPFSRISTEATEHLRKTGEIQFFQTLGLYWFFVNTESFPFNNKKIRQAFSYAINRQAIVDNLLQGNEIPAMSVLPSMLATQKDPFFHDNAQSRALAVFQEGLDEMGITLKDLPEITINYNIGSTHKTMAEALQQQWSQIFGIPIRLEQQEWKSHYDKLLKGNFQVGGMAWQSWLRDPIYIMQTFREKMNGVNMSRWDNPDYNRLITSAEKQADPAARKDFFNQAQALLMEEMPVIPVYFTTIAYAKNKKLKNIYMSELYDVDFRWAEIEK